ncbi:MAG: hypothetical protein ACI97A_003734 [Planctomycetota bacterium]|jgi:hypothetical protein
MKYMMLIYSAESAEPAYGTPEFSAHIEAYFAFNAEMTERGVFVGGDALEAISAATTVSIRDGKTETTDGPFAETKEQLGGYYILDCKDLDEAIECAAKIPSAAIGRIEVRPLVVFEN